MNSSLETALHTADQSQTTYSSMNNTYESNCSDVIVFKPMTATNVDYIIQHYIFPIQFILGVSGNSLNLLVLLSSSMKNQANTLLSAMAFADLAFLFCMVPFSLASFEPFYTNWKFRNFIYFYKIHGTPIANMFSAAATWFVLAVSIERFTGVRRPMHARFQLRDFRLCTLIGIIFLFSILVTLYQHFEYSISYTYDKTCEVWRPMLDVHNSDPKKIKEWFQNLVTISKYIQIASVVFIPVWVVAALNASLIYYVRRREIKTRAKGNDKDRRTSDFGNFQKQERKVTITVISIVTCFTITHFPGMGPYCYVMLKGGVYRPNHIFNNTITIINNILVSGKVLNFVLFCTSSAYFRRRTMIMLNSWCTNRRKKYSSMASSSFNNQQNVRLNQFRRQKSTPKMSSISTQGFETLDTSVPEGSTAFSLYLNNLHFPLLSHN
uniref:G_PROTEIN_RECEP_F1_2 domain-containing protein n=1 Tax=Panagrellus redivivus TaxID=6233 RepID=A0A7E4VV26_PANRE